MANQKKTDEDEKRDASANEPLLGEDEKVGEWSEDETDGAFVAAPPKPGEEGYQAAEIDRHSDGRKPLGQKEKLRSDDNDSGGG